MRSMALRVADIAVSILLWGDPIELEQSRMMISATSGSLSSSALMRSPSTSFAEMVTIACTTGQPGGRYSF